MNEFNKIETKPELETIFSDKETEVILNIVNQSMGEEISGILREKQGVIGLAKEIERITITGEHGNLELDEKYAKAFQIERDEESGNAPIIAIILKAYPDLFPSGDTEIQKHSRNTEYKMYINSIIRGVREVRDIRNQKDQTPETPDSEESIFSNFRNRD